MLFDSVSIDGEGGSSLEMLILLFLELEMRMSYCCSSAFSLSIKALLEFSKVLALPRD